MIIIGAGLSGLIAGRILQTRLIKTTIFEAQSSLPNNHSAVLRFRSSIVGDRTVIPFRKVTMVKCAHPNINPVADALTYSYKCSGVYRSDRSIPTGSKTEERFIAPADFITQLAADLDIQYAARFHPRRQDLKFPIISTMPMPALMEVLRYPGKRPAFHSMQAINIRFEIEGCDAYASVYDPAPESFISRVSITGNEVICECPLALIDTWDDSINEFVLRRALELLGIRDKLLINPLSVSVSKSAYSKILPVDDKARKDFMAWATETYNVYSLGRFATWRPNLLLDDLVHDIDRITEWARTGEPYDRKRVAYRDSQLMGAR